MRENERTWPWLSAYPPGIDWQATFQDMPVGRLLHDSVSRYPDRPCLDFLGKTWAYAELGSLVARAAKGLAALGVGKGVRVALVLPNTLFYVVTYYAVLETGGTIVNVNPLYTEREIRHLVEDAGAEIVVTLDVKAIHPKVAALPGTTPVRKVIVCRLADSLPFPQRLLYGIFKRSETVRPPYDGAQIDFAALIDNDGRFVPADIDPATDLAVLQYTGGTTGAPKGAMLTHRNLVANVRQCVEWFPDMVPGHERVLAVLPFFHVFAMTVALNLPIAIGAEITMLPRFDIGTLLAAIRRKRPTEMPAVPTLLTAIYSHPDIARHDLTSIKSCISGGAPLPVEVKSKFEALTRCTVVEGYGLSETSPVVACNPFRGANKPGSVGLPLPGTIVEIAAIDDPARVLPPGERGEVVISGPQVMAGYWRQPEETERVLKDGRLRTGDVGYLDDEGYLFLVDRIKDMIIAGGFNIYPRNVEDAIYQHPKVAECIVMGVPDPYRGQTVKAFVVPVEGQHLEEFELRDFLADRLSPIEVPKLFEFRAGLPRTLIGKPSRKALIEEEARLARSAPEE